MLKLKRFSEGVWFDYPEGGKFKIRAITPYHFLKIREQCKRKMIIKNPDGENQIIDDYDDAKLSWLLFDYVLEDFSEVEVDGNPSKPEVKEIIFNDRVIRDWIMEQGNQVFKAEENRLSGELKNSGTSQPES